MKALKTKVAVFALTTGIAGGLMAEPVFGAASPNDNAKNCHGVVLSFLSSRLGTPPGQIQKDSDLSVKDVQAVADLLCS